MGQTITIVFVTVLGLVGLLAMLKLVFEDLRDSVRAVRGRRRSTVRGFEVLPPDATTAVRASAGDAP